MMVMKISKKILIIISIILVGILINSKVLAVNYTLNVNFDGKNIEMISPTPDMIWEVKKMQPGEEQYNIITASNKGTRNVIVEFDSAIVDEEDIARILDLKIVKLVNDNPSLDELVFSGKCADMGKVSFGLDVGKNQSYKISVCLPSEAGSEYKGKTCKLKLNFTASGLADTLVTTQVEEAQNISDTESTENGGQDNTGITQAQNAERISTSTIKAMETGESKWVFVVIIILVGIFIVLLICFLNIKRSK